MDMESENLRREWIIKRKRMCGMNGEELKSTYKKIIVLMDQANDLIVKMIEENRLLRDRLLEAEHQLRLTKAQQYANQENHRSTERGLDFGK